VYSNYEFTILLSQVGRDDAITANRILPKTKFVGLHYSVRVQFPVPDIYFGM